MCPEPDSGNRLGCVSDGFTRNGESKEVGCKHYGLTVLNRVILPEYRLQGCPWLCSFTQCSFTHLKALPQDSGILWSPILGYNLVLDGYICWLNTWTCTHIANTLNFTVSVATSHCLVYSFNLGDKSLSLTKLYLGSSELIFQLGLEFWTSCSYLMVQF